MTRGDWPQAVLFDAAGTLIELRESVGLTYSRLAAEHGVSLPAARLDDAFHRVMRAAPPRVFPEAPAEQIDAREKQWWRERVRSTFLATDSTVRFPDFDAFFDALWEEYSGDRSWRARPGASELLAQLEQGGLRLAVVSNFDRRLREILAALGLAQRLAAIVLPADCGAEKPDERIFEAALAELGVPASACVYVGDDPARDLAGATRAGLVAVDVAEIGGLGELPARLRSLATLRSPQRN